MDGLCRGRLARETLANKLRGLCEQNADVCHSSQSPSCSLNYYVYRTITDAGQYQYNIERVTPLLLQCSRGWSRQAVRCQYY